MISAGGLGYSGGPDSQADNRGIKQHPKRRSAGVRPKNERQSVR